MSPVFFLMIFALFCFSLLMRPFEKRIKIVFNDVIWFLANALIRCPKVTAFLAVWRFVGVTWLVGVFLLQQLFAGEMFKAMTLAPGLDVIDNFDDLALFTAGPISVFDTFGAGRDKFFSSGRQHRQLLTNRIKILFGSQMYKDDLVKELLTNITRGSQFHLGVLYQLEQYRDKHGSGFGESLHISSEFGQFSPVFIMLNKWIETPIENVFNSV